jgi:hypothetical protein
VGEARVWSETVNSLLDEWERRPEMWERRQSDALHAARRFDALDHVRGILSIYRDMLPGRIPEIDIAGRSEDRPLHHDERHDELVAAR